MCDKKIKALIIMLNLLFCLSPSVLAADATELNQLVENPETMDGRVVTVLGEAIGEAMERGDYAWININDGTNAMGIWMTLDQAQSVKVFGDYKHAGDQVEIIGVFNRACTEHGGEMDIHCQQLEIVRPGFDTPEDISIRKVVLALVLSGLALAIGLAYWGIIRKN